MFYPPTSSLSLLPEPPAPRPVYDIPPVIFPVPRRRLRLPARKASDTNLVAGCAGNQVRQARG
jgi:hypothetical protein